MREVQALVAAGVTFFVDLTEEGELEPYRLPRHLRMPIPDFGVPSAADLRRTLDQHQERSLIDDPVRLADPSRHRERRSALERAAVLDGATR